MRTRVVRVDGTSDHVELPEGESHERLKAMYAAIGCDYVDVVRLVEAGPGRPGLDMWIDDVGLFTKEPNAVATLMVAGIVDTPLTQLIHGDVLFTGGADSEGDTLPLTITQDTVLRDIAAQVVAGGLDKLALTNQPGKGATSK